MRGRRVLLINGDEGDGEPLRSLYEQGGAEFAAAPGVEGLKTLYRLRPDLVLIGSSTPPPDRWHMLSRIRELTDVPVLMLGAAGEEDEKVRALRAGADDCLTPPYAVEELLARSEALLRRLGQSEDQARVYADGLVEVDIRSAEARAAGRPLNLTPLEFRLLWAFVSNANHVLSSEQLLELAWGNGGSARERVKIYVGYLRSKFRAAGVEDAPIETVRGFGYRYRPT